MDAGKRRTKKNYVKACRRQSDDKSDDKKLMRIAKALILLTFLRVGFKTLTPYVRVRILLPLPDIGLNRYDSSRFSLFSASFCSKKFRAKKLYPYRDPYSRADIPKKRDKYRVFRHLGHHIPGICRTYSSIRFALAVFMASETCPYTSRVKAAVA